METHKVGRQREIMKLIYGCCWWQPWDCHSFSLRLGTLNQKEGSWQGKRNAFVGNIKEKNYERFKPKRSFCFYFNLDKYFTVVKKSICTYSTFWGLFFVRDTTVLHSIDMIFHMHNNFAWITLSLYTNPLLVTSSVHDQFLYWLKFISSVIAYYMWIYWSLKKTQIVLNLSAWHIWHYTFSATL